MYLTIGDLFAILSFLVIFADYIRDHNKKITAGLPNYAVIFNL